MSTVFLDIETASADELYTYGPGFCRLAGYAIDGGAVELTTDMHKLCAFLMSADLVVAHNAIGFDLAALEHEHGLDVRRLVWEGRVRDTLLMARQAWPPLSGPGHPKASDGLGYGLDDVARRLDVGAKLSTGGTSVLGRLRDTYGGYDRIPVSDPEYREYLVRDVELLREVAVRLPVDIYVLREHEVMRRLGHISRSGFRLDVPEVERRVRGQEKRLDALKRQMAERYGMPLESARPHMTTAGKASVEAAFAAFNVEPPRTSKGTLSTGKAALADLMAEHPANADLQQLCGLLLALNGERSTAAMLAEFAGPDGRVHPQVSASQATGRISVTRPGLTTIGKRDRVNVLERSLLLPDDGDVLLSVDLSQIDARAMAALSQDPAYIEAFAPGEDLHAVMAEALLGDRGRRDEAKAITHATTYGMGARALAAQSGRSEEDASALLGRLEDQYPLLAQCKREVRVNAEHDGEVRTAFGRRIGIARDRAYTQAPAAAGQGTARDLMMEGVLRLPEALLPCLRAIVHDELVLSVPEDEYESARRAVLTALQFDFRVSAEAAAVPVLAQAAEPGRDWADCYREEKSSWPEVARDHREQAVCADSGCTWHGAA